MARRHVIAALALTLALPAMAHAESSTQPATTEGGNPINDQGSSYHYRTYVRSITPKLPGLSVEVLEFADRLLLRNHTGQTVIVYGYSGEPYARMLPNGATEQNARSPAVYLNTNFYANVTVPASANASASAKWQLVDRTGQFEWHDHRIHWMSPVTPPQVKDKSRRTKIFDWSVPIQIGAQRGAIDGELFWVPESSSVPVAAIVALVVIIGAGALLVAVMRRRRAMRPTPTAGDGDPGAASGHREAW